MLKISGLFYISVFKGSSCETHVFFIAPNSTITLYVILIYIINVMPYSYINAVFLNYIIPKSIEIKNVRNFFKGVDGRD